MRNPVELRNTIIIIMIEILFLFYFMKPEKKKKHKLSLIAGYVILVSQLVFMAVNNMNVIDKFFVTWINSVAVFYIVYKLPMKKVVVDVTLFILASLIGEMVVFMLFTYFRNDYFFIKNQYNPRYEAIICSKLIMFIVLILIKKFRNKEGRKMSFQDFMTISAPIILSIFVLYMMGIVVYDFRIAIIENIPLFLMVFLAFMFSSIYSIIVSDHYLKVKAEEYRDRIRFIQMESQYKYYKERQEDERNVQRMYHDLKNHMLVLQKELASSEESKNYIQAVLNKIKPYERYIETGNRFLDIIISEKIKTAREHLIRTEAFADFTKMEFMDPMDISTLFGNALDNAIEACENVPEVDRVITIKTRWINENMVIKFENPYNNKLNFLEGKLRTTKKNIQEHGFGTENIQIVVEKYKGDCRIITMDGKFILIIKIPEE